MNKLSDIDYLELQACSGGCIGGALTVENRFVAKVKLRKLVEKLGTNTRIDETSVVKYFVKGYYDFEEEISLHRLLNSTKT
ncbi:hypothetical protein [Thermosediminibacter oceani]|uniref:hypothetical protein n=1 Tax=Thermosediminibacter oceani TaxID=291990 RepID=UPI0002F31519|nr:hypothetical protein [Thermosediminibacter oceani]